MPQLPQFCGSASSGRHTPLHRLVPAGHTHAVAPAFDRGIERPISDYFDRYHLIGMDHYAMRAPGLAETLGADLVVQDGRQAA